MTTDYETMSQTELFDALATLKANPEGQSAAEQVERLLHELQVHQIELEMQNRELREAQLRMEESRSRYSDLFDFAPAGYCTFDASGRVHEINLAAAALLRVDRARIAGQPFTSILPLEERQRFRNHIQQCFAEAKRVTAELGLPVKDHGPITIELISTPVTGLDGTVTACRTMLNDISALKQSEKAFRFLAEASDALSSSLDYASTLATVVRLAVPVLADICFLDVVDEEGLVRRLEVAFADPRKLHLTRAVQRSSPDSKHERLRARVLQSGAPVMISDPAKAAAVAPKFESTDLPCSLILVPVSARQRTLGVLTLIMAESGRIYSNRELELAKDVAGRAAMAIDNAQLYETAQIATQLRDEVLAVVAHDLKKPLSSIIGGTSDLMQSAPADDRRAGRKQIEAIKRSADRMDSLISDLLDLSGLEVAHLPLHCAEHPVNELLHDAYAMLRPLLHPKNLQFALQAVDQSLNVLCDRSRVLRVFSELIGNAISSTPPGGTISIRSDVTGNKARFVVSDTGPGMDPGALRHLFERQGQEEEKADKGRALRLHSSKSIVEAHGGSIWVESSHGSGTSFYFTLPLLSAVAKRADHRAMRSRLRTMVLIVDPDDQVREGLKQRLEAEGHPVAEAAGGIEALHYLHASKTVPALILLGLQQPMADGLQLLTELKNHPVLSMVPVIVVSNQPGLKDKLGAFGITAYLEKPLQLERLLETISFQRDHNRPARLM